MLCDGYNIRFWVLEDEYKDEYEYEYEYELELELNKYPFYAVRALSFPMFTLQTFPHHLSEKLFGTENDILKTLFGILIHRHCFVKRAHLAP